MIRYEKMEPSHVRQVAALETVCFSDPWSESSIAGELENRLSLWLVAVDGEKVVGYVGSQTVLGETDMMNIAIDPAYRRRGIARQLIGKLIEALKERGSHSLMLEVRAGNAAAIALYESMGFTVAGKRPNYYRNPKEDAWILRKEWQI